MYLVPPSACGRRNTQAIDAADLQHDCGFDSGKVLFQRILATGAMRVLADPVGFNNWMQI